MKSLPYLFITLSILICRFANAQAPGHATISGKVIEESTKEPISFSSVALYQTINFKDSLVAGAQSNEVGEFSISKIPIGTFTLRVSFVGYQTLDKQISITGNDEQVSLGSFALKTDTKILQEVEVVGQKSDMEINQDKRIFNVTNNLTSVGGTAESLLRNVPSLTIDESGSASLRNMPATIYVDGKPTQLTLAQIPANQIASVEVISNPSAKYDASTSGGIVNLVLKHNREQGYNGLMSLGVGNNSRYDATVNLNWQRGKWNLTGLYSLNATKNPLTGYVHREQISPTGSIANNFDQNTNISLNNLFQSGRLEAYFRPDNKNTFSLAGTIVGGAFNTVSNQSYYYSDAAGTVTSFGNRNTVPENDYINTGVELDWRRQFARKGRELHATASMTHNNVSNAGDWLTSAYDIVGMDTTTQQGYPIQNRIDGRIIGNQTLFQIDYVNPVSETAKWEFGFRSFTYLRDQQYLFMEVNDGIETVLPDYSQDARITETVNAVYSMYQKNFSKSLSVEAGIRLEQSSLHGVSRFDGSKFGYNYPSKTGQNFFQSFFPSFAINKIVNETSQWNFSLSRKVGRPNFRHMFVGIQANDRQNITIGNPSVRPEFVNTAEFNYNKVWNIGADRSIQWLPTAYYIYEDHTIKPLVSPLPTDSTILVTTFQNVKADIRYGLDNTVTYSAGPLGLLLNFNAYEVILQSVAYVNKMVGYSAKLNVTYKLPYGISAQATGQRRSRNPGLQGYQKAVTGVDFAIRKSFMQNKASVTFSINDVFNSRKFVSVYDQPGIYQESMNRREIRFYKLSVQFPLGKITNAKMKERSVDRPDIDFSN